MSTKDQWPFIPRSLRDVVDYETLAVIESGCCERLGRPLIILDYEPTAETFIPISSIHPRQRFEAFCVFWRDEWKPGGNQLCIDHDRKQARLTQELLSTNGPFRVFNCYMGLIDATYVIEIAKNPVAILISGQYKPIEGTGTIKTNVKQRLGELNTADQELERKLYDLADQLTPEPDDLELRLCKEAKHIQDFVQLEYDRQKQQWEYEFLDDFRAASQTNGEATLEALRGQMRKLLGLIKTFCHCKYAVFFASVSDEATVLAPITSVGIDEPVAAKLPHFNWKKAKLKIESFVQDDWVIADNAEIASNGIRGENKEFFTDVGVVVPVARGNRYRCALVLGPFEEKNVYLEREKRFLHSVGEIIGNCFFTGLEIRDLEQEQHRWKSTARLVTHQVKTSLTPLTTQISYAKLLAQSVSAGQKIGKIAEKLQRSEDLCMQVAESAQRTIDGHVILLERSDLNFERYSLSALLVDIVNTFVPEAEKRHREILADKSLEQLPEAEIDVARLTIVFSNLLDNAIKYSYPSTKIYLQAHLDMVDLHHNDTNAVIEIEDWGDDIPASEREHIFEEGTRGLTHARFGRIPGSGLGLWEARAVIHAHGGEIGVVSTESSIKRHQGIAHQVVFSIKIPLRQPE